MTAGLAGIWPVPEHSAELLRRTIAATDSLPAGGRLVNVSAAARFEFIPIGAARHSTNQNPFVDLILRHLAAAANCLQVFALRVVSLAGYLPAMALIVGVIFIDALVTRNLRRLRASRESGYVFHRLQRFRGAVLWLPIFLVMASPVFVPPLLIAAIVLPAAAYIWIQVVLFAPRV